MPHAASYADGCLIGRRYEVFRTIFGGMGEVIFCRDSRPNDYVIDTLHAQLSGLSGDGLDREWDPSLVVLKTLIDREDQQAQACFVHEAEAWLQLGFAQGRYFLGLLAIEQYDKRPFLVMPAMPSGHLRQQMTHGQLTLSQKVSILTQLLVGVQTINQHGIVHRDLKPENVLFDANGCIKITDLGIARAAPVAARAEGVAHTSASGTLPYMAPEQVQGDASMDWRVDQWAWAVIAIELLTNQHPFMDDTPQQLVHRIFTHPPRGIDMLIKNTNKAVGRVIARCLEKNPNRRFATWHELIQAWDRLIQLPHTPRRRGFWCWRRGQAIVIENTRLDSAWQRYFPDRVNDLRQPHAMTPEILRHLKDARGLEALERYDQAIDLLWRVLGEPDGKKSLLGRLLRGELPEVGVSKSEGRHGVVVEDNPIFTMAVLVQLLRCYVALLSDHPNRQDVAAEAQALARHIADSIRVGDSQLECLLHVAQILTITGPRDDSRKLLRRILKHREDHERAWSALFYGYQLDGDVEGALDVLNAVLDSLKRHDRFTFWFQATMMAGNLQSMGVSLESSSGLVAICAKNAVRLEPDDVDSLYYLITSLYNLDQINDAANYYQHLVNIAPGSNRAQQLMSYFKAAG